MFIKLKVVCCVCKFQFQMLINELEILIFVRYLPKFFPEFSL